MKLKILYVLFWIVILGFCLGAIPQTVQVEQKFHVADFTFVTRDIEDWEQFQLLIKLNALSVKIVQAEARGEHPYALLKEFKKLAKQLKE